VPIAATFCRAVDRILALSVRVRLIDRQTLVVKILAFEKWSAHERI
jgi:hypothetical protein